MAVLSRHWRKVRPRATAGLPHLTDEEMEARAGGVTGHSPELASAQRLSSRPGTPASASSLEWRRARRGPPGEGLRDAVEALQATQGLPPVLCVYTTLKKIYSFRLPEALGTLKAARPWHFVN